MKTAPTNKKVRELITMVREGKLIPRPEFQRRLVWTINDKNHFLDSIIRGYPVPEIYVADGDVNLETGEGTQLLVDGLQRVSTLVQYFDADADLKLTSIQQYKNLSQDDKQAFLQYDVAVRDLGAINREQIIEVFRRINSTKYGLNDIEINNAVYAGALRQFADKISELPLFTDHRVFSSQDYKRMGDLRFALSLIVAALGGYANRDDGFEDFLDRYNDEFEPGRDLERNFRLVADFIDECGFLPSSRIWRKADLFTIFTELYFILSVNPNALDPLNVVNSVQEFYDTIANSDLNDGTLSGIYYKAAVQASNDRINRIRRGEIICGILIGQRRNEIMENLRNKGLV